MTKPYEPKQKTIRNKCAKLQRDWSADEKRKRSGATKKKPWLPPIINTQLLDEAEEQETESGQQI